MKRKSLLAGGTLLSIVYALCFVVSIALGVTCAIYFFVSDSIQMLNDILLPIIDPFMSFGENIMMIMAGGLVLYCLMMLIMGTRYIKYAFASQTKYNRKRGMLVFNLIFFILTFGAFTYLLVYRLINIVFDLVLDITLIVFISLQLLGIIFAIVGLVKNPKTQEAPAIEQVNEEVEKIQDKKVQDKNEVVQEIKEPEESSHFQPIYTEGLDGESEKVNTKEQKAEKTTQKQSTEMESMTTKKLIESIGKLDQMRKDGEISTQEYTKLRGKLIKKFTK